MQVFWHPPPDRSAARSVTSITGAVYVGLFQSTRHRAKVVSIIYLTHDYLDVDLILSRSRPRAVFHRNHEYIRRCEKYLLNLYHTSLRVHCRLFPPDFRVRLGIRTLPVHG